MKKIALFLIVLSNLCACSFAPREERPSLPIPEHFKETGQWVKFKTTAKILAPNQWWEIYEDPTLNQLQQQLTLANQDLRVAFAHYQEAYADAQTARSELFPNLQALFNADRQQISRNIANAPLRYNYNQLLLGGYLSYEVDAWGSIRNAIKSADRKAKASAADVATMHLSLHAELAKNYFALRGSDEQQRILNKTVNAYRKALYFTRQRFKGGVSPIGDVDEALTQFENAKTLAADMRLQRRQIENAIAVLVGEIPSNFKIPAASLPHKWIAINPNIPSTLIERRPDIVAAEFRVQAANASIGVARAAFFPQFNLTGTGGFQSKSLSNLISKPSIFWSIGPLSLLTLVQPVAAVTVFDGGKLRSLLNKAKADYFANVANYRQTVLTAFQDVEDNLVAINQLDNEFKTQKAAAIAAKKAWIQEEYRYRGGLTTFLQVVVVENTALQAQLSEVNIKTRRMIASAQLIKALGGGWAQQSRTQ